MTGKSEIEINKFINDEHIWGWIFFLRWVSECLLQRWLAITFAPLMINLFTEHNEAGTLSWMPCLSLWSATDSSLRFYRSILIDYLFFRSLFSAIFISEMAGVIEFYKTTLRSNYSSCCNFLWDLLRDESDLAVYCDQKGTVGEGIVNLSARQPTSFLQNHETNSEKNKSLKKFLTKKICSDLTTFGI